MDKWLTVSLKRQAKYEVSSQDSWLESPSVFAMLHTHQTRLRAFHAIVSRVSGKTQRNVCQRWLGGTSPNWRQM